MLVLAQDGIGNITQSFPMPLKFDAGTVISAGASPLAGTIFGVIHGWLENISGFV